jgi:hypothetical protein
VTGGRPGRDPRIAGRRERGPQRGEAPPGEARWTGTGGAELEEIGATVVSSRGGSGIGIRTAIAGVALVGLFAVGFGAFGGRPQPSTLPVWSPVAVASQGNVPTPRIAEPELPSVTPFEPCAVERNTIPTVFLEVADEVHAGAIEVLGGNPDALSPEHPMSGEPRTVPVAIGDKTAIVIDGARCALAWVVDFDATMTIDVVANGPMDPARAAQNRFALALGENPGRQSRLRAQLVFPGLTVRASWDVRVAPSDHPMARVHWLEGSVAGAVEGCSVGVEFMNGWREPTDACEPSVLPAGDGKTRRGTGAFRFTLEGWEVGFGAVSCGMGIEGTFVPDETGCAFTADDPGGVVTVDFPPSFVGKGLTLAIDACGINGPIPAAVICGTWYASVNVR